MKIQNPTVFLRDGELFCLTVAEIPQKPPRYFTHYVCDGKAYETGQGAAKAYSEYLEKAKSSAVRVKNMEQIFFHADLTYTFAKNPDQFYNLNGYEAEVAEEPEYPIDHTSYPPYIKFATITPIAK